MPRMITPGGIAPPRQRRMRGPRRAIAGLVPALLCLAVTPAAWAQVGNWTIVWQPRDGGARVSSGGTYASLSTCERELSSWLATDAAQRRQAEQRVPPLAATEWRQLNADSERVSSAVCIRR